jgi:hypothetical protein
LQKASFFCKNKKSGISHFFYCATFELSRYSFINFVTIGADFLNIEVPKLTTVPKLNSQLFSSTFVLFSTKLELSQYKEPFTVNTFSVFILSDLIFQLSRTI